MQRLSEEIRSTLSADGGIILDIRHGRMLRVNPSGAQILELLRAGMADNEIVAKLVRMYGIDADRASSDFREFLASLQEHHLLQARESGERP